MRLFLFSCLFMTAAAAISQEKQDLKPCGTTDGRVPWLQAYQANPEAYPKSNYILLVPVTIHLVGNSAGSGYFNTQTLLESFCTLNEDFEPAAIQFYIEGDIHFIPNSTFFNHDWDAGHQMMVENNVPNTINCYIVESPAGNCGYSAWNLGVALAKSCTGPTDHTWAHEIGHFLSLPHPFYGWEGYEHNYSQPAPAEIDGHPVERLDGLNCTNAGDGFCDTPPDYLNYRWNCDIQNQSTVQQKDPTGVAFVSDGSLYMSYSLDDCMSRFTPDQIKAMRANVLTDKESFLYNQTPLEPVQTTSLNPISPAEGETVPYFQSVTFQWEPMPHATHYLLEISRYEHFPFVLFRYIVEGTTLTSTDLFKNKSYYWRVLPFNSQHTCTGVYSNAKPFFTGELSGVPVIESVSELQLEPNPASSDREVQISLTTGESLRLDARLLNVAGQVFQHFQWNVIPGQNRKLLSTEELQSGLYFLQLRSEKGVLTKKLVIGK